MNALYNADAQLLHWYWQGWITDCGTMSDTTMGLETWGLNYKISYDSLTIILR